MSCQNFVVTEQSGRFYEDPLSTIIECSSLRESLREDVHSTPYKLLGDRSGSLQNISVEESDTTFLMRDVVSEMGCHKSILRSFDNLLLTRIPRKILGTVIVVNKIKITFANIRIMKPFYTEYHNKNNLTPRLARFKKLSYNVKIYADILHYNRDFGDLVLEEKFVEVAEIPVMLGSVGCHLYKLTDAEMQQLGECPNDTLGYFLNNGSEKVFKNKETIRYNIPMTYYFKDFYETRFTCFSNSSSGTTLMLIKVFDNKKDITNIFTVILQHFKREETRCNVFLLFRFLGWGSDKALDVITSFSRMVENQKTKVRKLLQDSVSHSNMIEDSHLFGFFQSIDKDVDVKKLDESSTRERILYNLFSNTSDTEKKLYMLAYVVCHTAMVKLGIIQEDDRNSWSNKKLITASGVVETHFNSIWSNFISETDKLMQSVSEDYLVNSIPMADKYFSKFSMKKKISDIFSTKAKFSGGKEIKPQSEQFKRITPIDGTSQITKTFAQTSTRDKKNEVRTIHSTQIFVACPAETPENSQIGAVKNLAIGCWLSFNRQTPPLPFLEGKISNHMEKERDIPIFVNGEFLGFVEKDVYLLLKTKKSEGVIPFDACVHYNPTQHSIELLTMDTRTCIPLLIVNNGSLVIDTKKMWGRPFYELMKAGCLEWLDVREAEYAKIAESVNKIREESRIDRYTHSCIQTNMMFGWAACISPWSNRNKGPRVVYQAGMSKQSLCAFSSVHHLNFDSFYKILNWATRPLCESNTNRLIGLETMPTSQNIIVAVLARPDNNEDAVEMKKESLDKQIFRISKYTTIAVSIDNKGAIREVLTKPLVSEGKYSNIGSDGLPKIGSHIKRGDCIVYKVKSPGNDTIIFNKTKGEYETTSGDLLEDSSKYAGIDEDGFVEKVFVMENLAETVIRIKILQYRKYEPGDKVALRYSQKGTVGRLVKACDMPRILGGPFDGVSPDEMFSPLSVPTRMTAALPVELLSGLVSILTGKRMDSTTFEDYDINSLSRILKEIGEKKYGLDGEDLEDFSNGLFKMTRSDGKVMGEWVLEDGKEVFKPTKVFVGPMAVQALRHHVVDKFQVRKKGSTNALTRQGVSGRSRHGALRFGEMESDAVKSAGAADILIERLKTVADEFKLFMCSCGSEAIAKPQEKTVVCLSNKHHGKVGDNHTFGVAKVTYISILIKRLLAVAGIDFKMIPRQNK